MNCNSNSTECANTPTVERLQSLRNLISNFRMLEVDGLGLKMAPITENLKMLHCAFMESQWPAILPSDERITLNEYFWKVYETASYIEQMADPSENRQALLMTIDGLMLACNQKELEEAS